MSGVERKQWAVVAGATGSLGGAIARKLVAKGLKVLAVGRREEELANLAKESPHFIPCVADLSDNAAVDVIAKAIGDGPVKLIAQAIGLPIRPKDQPFDPNSVGFATNIKIGGLLRLTSALDDRLARGSQIVALGGYHGFEPDPTALGPGVVNAALANLIRQLSVRYGARGISVHLISPGPVDTVRIRKLADDAARQTNGDPEQILDGWRKESSFGQLITTDQVAWAVGLLLDPEADALHGSVLHIDGGRRKGII